jgi:uncharacterized protein (DUF302 family)
MRKSLFTTALLVLFGVSPLFASEGTINVPSDFSVEETADRFENILNNKKMTLFGRVKHSDSALKVGVELRPTELFLFGNPKMGSPLMQCEQRLAIDLPQKALIWKDEEGKVWITYNAPGYLQQRHNISGCEELLKKLEAALGGMAKAAATAEPPAK